jgi:ribosomal protein S27AE
MDVLTACQAPIVGLGFSRPNCPRCGAALFVAEQSALAPNGRIHHAWSCDDCGNEFVTSICVFPRQT